MSFKQYKTGEFYLFLFSLGQRIWRHGDGSLCPFTMSDLDLAGQILLLDKTVLLQSNSLKPMGLMYVCLG